MASIRENAISYIKTQLATITLDTRYPSGIGTSRVVGIKENPTSVPTPVVLIMQGEEEVDNRVGDRYICVLDLSIGFVDNSRSEDPDLDATTFMSEIQSVLPIEFNVSAPHYTGNNDAATTKVSLLEVGNTINVSSAVPGLILGQISYEMHYRRHILDPDKQ